MSKIKNTKENVTSGMEDFEYSCPLTTLFTSGQVSASSDRIKEFIQTQLMTILTSEEKQVLRKRFGLDEKILSGDDMTVSAAPLSKSKILSYLQCPKRLWLETFQPENAQVDEDAQARREIGTQIGIIAHGLFPGGLLIDEGSTEEALRLTSEALNTSPRPLYEAAFMRDNVLAKVDIFLPEPGGWRLIEVKSTSSVKDYHIADAAIQFWAVQGFGLALRGVEIAFINKDFVYSRNGDYSGLFARQDVAEKVQACLPDVPKWVAGAANVISSPDKTPECTPGEQCKAPFPCPFKGYCSPVEADAFSLETLPGIREQKLRYFQEQGYLSIRDIPDSVELTPKQTLVHNAVKDNRLIVSKDVASVMEALAYPRFYLDFETIRFTVPRWPGTRPNEQIPFQWSCHIEDAPGKKPRHYEFLAKEDINPRHDFAESLVACFTGEEPGPVIVYNAAFEKTILEQTALFVPEFAKQLHAINDQITIHSDLLRVAQKHYYHPGMNGSWSIKRVLPTIAPDLHYSNLAVQHGGMAQAAFLDIINGSPQRDALYDALLAYCKLDTEAMWRIARYFAGDRAELGRHYLYGTHAAIKENKELGFDLLSSARELGYGDDRVIADLIHCYVYGWGTEQSIPMASQLLELFHDEIKRGDPDPMYLLGLVSHESSSEPNVGLEWIRKAAEKGHAKAMEFLKENDT